MANKKPNLHQYRRLLVKAEKASKEVYKYRQLLAQNCKHPAEFVGNYPWEHDNGYGRQSKMIGKICGICLKKDIWDIGQFKDTYMV